MEDSRILSLSQTIFDVELVIGTHGTAFTDEPIHSAPASIHTTERVYNEATNETHHIRTQCRQFRWINRRRILRFQVSTFLLGFTHLEYFSTTTIICVLLELFFLFCVKTVCVLCFCWNVYDFRSVLCLPIVFISFLSLLVLSGRNSTVLVLLVWCCE